MTATCRVCGAEYVGTRASKYCSVSCSNRGRPQMAAHRRFLRFITVTDTCWLWTGARRDGYGRFGPTTQKRVEAHRFAYELFVAPIPEGLQLDHLCRTPACVRPDHLEPVTSRENTLRGVSIVADNARKTRCAQGHELETLDHQRVCRICKRERDRNRRASRSA